MPPKPSSKPAESTSRSTEPPSKTTLTPQQTLELKLKMDKFDKSIREALKDGLDLSNKETP